MSGNVRKATRCATCLELAARARRAHDDAEAHIEAAPAGDAHRRAVAEACGQLEGMLIRFARALERHAAEHGAAA